jgi:hypothetical protein
MPYSTAWTKRGVTWTYWGTVSGEELLRSNREVYVDRRFSEIRFQIIDLTRVDRFEVTADEMDSLAASDHTAALMNPSVRVAVAAKDELIRLLSLRYEAQSSDSPWSQQIFDTVAEARRWAMNGIHD